MVVMGQEEDDWWYGTCTESGEEGWFPATYVTTVDDCGVEVLKGESFLLSVVDDLKIFIADKQEVM